MCAFFVGDRNRTRGLLLGIRCFTTCFEGWVFAWVINSAFHRLLGVRGAFLVVTMTGDATGNWWAGVS